jgi:hypothetical protein
LAPHRPPVAVHCLPAPSVDRRTVPAAPRVASQAKSACRRPLCTILLITDADRRVVQDAYGAPESLCPGASGGKFSTV